MAIETVKQDDGSILVRINGHGHPLRCLVCGNDAFDERGALLNSRGGEFFGFAWADEKATNFVCRNCGYIFWFLT